MLKIRLARIGKRKSPSYRIIVSESTRDTWGASLELLGHYEPFSKVFEVKKDRVLHWVKSGAQLSPTIHNLFVEKNVIEGKKVVASSRGKKAEAERLAAVVAANAPKPKVEAAPEVAAPAEAPVAEVPVAPVETPAPEEKKEEAPAA